MEENKFIETKVKVFYLVQIKEIIRSEVERCFVFDESKTAVCFGMIIDDIAIALAQNIIYPIFNYSDETELNTYYLYKCYDYGDKIPKEDGFITLEEDPKILKKWYQKTIDWYYDEVLKREKNNIINFEKAKALRYARSVDI